MCRVIGAEVPDVGARHNIQSSSCISVAAIVPLWLIAHAPDVHGVRNNRLRR